jgi:hypothetical protein
MKKLLLGLLVFFTLGLSAQGVKGMFSKDPIVNLENFDKQRVHWGYFLGFSMYDYAIDYKELAAEVTVNQTTGFNVGLVGDLKLQEYINLRFEPGLYYTTRNLVFPNFSDATDAERKVAKRTGNIRPYLLGGVSTTLNLSSNSKSIDDNMQGKFRVQQWTKNYEVGFGIDLYMEYFKFSPSIRGVFGLGDELVRDTDPLSPWTSNINSMKTRAILVNFTFH